ncbi:MAG: hypothetical protein IPK63_15080 [Candidatus Competibacteraceae bacterium]|nr:hypothetical protein [Candidatus Competibacteraceae bacterium]
MKEAEPAQKGAALREAALKISGEIPARLYPPRRAERRRFSQSGQTLPADY